MSVKHVKKSATSKTVRASKRKAAKKVIKKAFTIPKDPKTRKEKAISKIIEKQGNVSAALKEAGYSESYSHNPQEFKQTKTFKTMAEALLDAIPRNEITRMHKNLLNAEQLRPINFDHKLTDDEVKESFAEQGYKVMNIKRFMTNATAFVFVPENDVRKGAMDMLYKVLGDYAAEKLEVTDPLRVMSDEELMQKKKDLIAKLKKKPIAK